MTCIGQRFLIVNRSMQVVLHWIKNSMKKSPLPCRKARRKCSDNVQNLLKAWCYLLFLWRESAFKSVPLKRIKCSFGERSVCGALIVNGFFKAPFDSLRESMIDLSDTFLHLVICCSGHEPGFDGYLLLLGVRVRLFVETAYSSLNMLTRL